MWNSNYSIIDELINSKDPRREKTTNVMLDADEVINNSSQKVCGSNAYPDPAPKKVGRSGPRKTHRIYAPCA